VLTVIILQRTCIDSYQLNMTTELEGCFKHEVRKGMRFFNERNMSAEKYVVKQVTFTGSTRRAERMWQYGEQTLQPDKSVRTIVTASDNPQQQPRQKRDTCGTFNSEQATRIKPLL
jgi:hypothetical protein